MSDLTQGARSIVEVEGQPLTFFWTGRPSVLTIKTPVYCGENYIPASVRSSLPRGKSGHTFFTIDEDQFEISMLAQVDAYSMTSREFESVISDFCSEANVWRTRLDGKDRNDLLFVRTPR